MPTSVSAAQSRALILGARITAVLAMICVAVSFISAGFVVRDYEGLGVHGFAAIALHVTTGLLAIVLAIHAKTTGGRWLAASVAIAVFALTFVQASLGNSDSIAVHVAGSLVIAAGVTWLVTHTFQSIKTAPDRNF